MVFNVIIQKYKNGYFAQVPELKGCFSQGDSLEEVDKNIKEAIELYLETMDKEEIQELHQKNSFIRPLEVLIEK